MADTKRTSTYLLNTIFPDGQGDNSINAQDLRDYVVSLLAPRASCQMEGNSTETTINTSNVYEAIAGTFTTMNTSDFSISSAGVFTYNGSVNRHVFLLAQISAISASNSQIIKFSWHKTTTGPTTTRLAARARRKIGTGSDVGNMCCFSDTVVTNGDTLDLRVSNEGATNNFTIEDCYLAVAGVFL